MLEDLLENQHISCKVLRQNINIHVECTIKDEMLDNKLYFYAANTPDRLTTFSGSGLPFPNKYIAFEGSPNIGRINVNKEKKFTLKLLRPNSYYDDNFELIEPEVIIKYYLINNKTRVLNIPIDNRIPYRNLLKNNNNKKNDIIRLLDTQEKILLKNQYPDILI